MGESLEFRIEQLERDVERHKGLATKRLDLLLDMTDSLLIMTDEKESLRRRLKVAEQKCMKLREERGVAAMNLASSRRTVEELQVRVRDQRAVVSEQLEQIESLKLELSKERVCRESSEDRKPEGGPTLGVAPYGLWVIRRVKSLEDAIKRFRAAGKEIPAHWESELEHRRVELHVRELMDTPLEAF